MLPDQNIKSAPRPWYSVTALAGLVIACLSCWPIAHAADLVIWESGDQIVQLAKQDDASAPPNDHPASLTTSQIEAMLDALRLRYVDQDADVAGVSLFTKEEIDNLGNAIATGLDRATPSQDVIFHVIGARRLSPGAFAKRNRVSAGRVFYRDGNLNIIFGQIQTPYRKKNIYGQIEEDFYPRNYGSRTTPVNHDVVLLTNAAAHLKHSDAGMRGDWIVIDPSSQPVVYGQPRGGAEPQPVQALEPSTAPAVVAETPKDPPPSPAKSKEVTPAQSEETSVPATPVSSDVEQRLEALQRLRERELISEEAYQAKMQEILRDL